MVTRLLLFLVFIAVTTGASSSASSAGGGGGGGSGSDRTINHLLRRGGRPLTQSYYALRHGQSLANVAGIISSDPSISTVRHGLSKLGREQAREAGRRFAEACREEAAGGADGGGEGRGGGSGGGSGGGRRHGGVAIYSSDFARARETASILADELRKAGVPIRGGGVALEERLRERHFGELNGGSDGRYREVWDLDANDADHEEFRVESANSVLERTSRLITELDEDLRRRPPSGDGGEGCWKCVLVAHGDVLQIMQTGFLRHGDASRHRSLLHLETATIRELSLQD